MGGFALSAIDSLDTLMLMNLTTEYSEAREMVSKVNFSKGGHVNTFETTIRCLGGLLSAHAVSGGGDPMLLQQAASLGERLMPAFVVGSGRLPHSDITLSSGKVLTLGPGGTVSIAESGTLSLEFLTLARLTKRPEFAAPIHAIRAQLRSLADSCGPLQPLNIDPQAGLHSGCPSGTIGLGARGDSYYEYLVKEHAMDRAQLAESGTYFLKALQQIEQSMLVEYGSGRNRSEHVFVAELIGGHGKFNARSKKMDHLVCFLPAAIAVGVHHGSVPRREGHMRVAARITETCIEMYGLAPTGLAPEIVKLRPDAHGVDELFVDVRDKHNLLRPEVAEALYFMWMATGRMRYRRAGWEMFTAFRRHSRRADGTYTSVSDVFQQPLVRRDEMPSWWIAETLKYLWLLFKPRTLLPMDDWVFTTEAHPLPTVRRGLLHG